MEVTNEDVQVAWSSPLLFDSDYGKKCQNFVCMDVRNGFDCEIFEYKIQFKNETVTNCSIIGIKRILFTKKQQICI